VVRGEPELSQLPEKTPQRIRELVQRCLIKDPKQRLQAIGEARIALDQWLSHPEEEAGAAALSKKWIWILGAVASTTTLLARNKRNALQAVEAATVQTNKSVEQIEEK
jgi:hypothetical protein